MQCALVAHSGQTKKKGTGKISNNLIRPLMCTSVRGKKTHFGRLFFLSTIHKNNRRHGNGKQTTTRTHTWFFFPHYYWLCMLRICTCQFRHKINKGAWKKMEKNTPKNNKKRRKTISLKCLFPSLQMHNKKFIISVWLLWGIIYLNHTHAEIYCQFS